MGEKAISYKITVFLKDLWFFIRPYKAKFFVATFFRVTSDLTNLYPAYAMSRIVLLLSNDAEPDRNLIFALLLGWFFAVMYRNVAKQFAKRSGYEIAERTSLDAKVMTLNHILLLDYGWQEKENSGNKLKRIYNGGRGLDQIIRIFFTNLIEGFINTVGISILLFSLGSWISFSLAFFIITFYILSFKFSAAAAKQGYKVSKEEEDLEGLSFEALNNIRTVKALALNAKIMDVIQEAVSKLYIEIKRRIFLYQGRGFILNIYYYTYQLAMISFLVLSILEGRYDISIIILFVGYLDKVGTAVWEITDVIQEIAIAKVWIHRMKEILNTKPAIDEVTKTKPYPTNWQTINIKNVNFSYGGQSVLTDLDINIKRGEKIGIVGLSGAGKSTLFKLLLNLYEDFTGEISVDDVSLKDINRNDYINHISVVLQDTELFNNSLRENIIIGKTESDGDPSQELSKAIEIAHLEELVEKLPQGMETVVGEKGVKLSGGEKQRVGIARALYRNPDILFLDEATSHLDADSERKIQDSLSQFFQKVTAVVIAHRLSTIKEMDRIIVLNDGKIVEQGSFEELIKQGGHFANLWEKQQI